ncbi:hypothetical protein AURDEDRAFT_59532, partial [Auricularia subglabra TFB-10046 SS5]
MAAAGRIAEEAGAPPHDVPVADDSLPPPERAIRMPRKRDPPRGRSGADVTVLTCRGKVGSQSDRTVDIRLDTCANLSLIQKKFLESLRNPPRIRKGMKLQIAQLTNNAPLIEGYVILPLFIRGEDGTELEFEVEAYVVPDMTVDLLVGEDWHVNYEISVLRNLEHGHRVGVSDTGYYFPASSHRRERARRFRRKQTSRNGELRAFKDVVIPAATTVLVDVAGRLHPDKEWYVERNLVCVGKDTFLSIPNTLLSSRTDTLPVANPTSRPWLLRAGTVLGRALDAEQALEKPKDEQDLEEKTAVASALAVL